MELKRFTENSWRVYHRGQFRAMITDYGKEWCLEINYKQYDIPKSWMTKQELKQTIQRMLDWNDLEVYSELVAEKRGFKILR